MSDNSTAPQTFNALALRVIVGETKAVEYIGALRDGTKQPDDLAVIVAALYGPELRGFCRVLANAVEAAHE